jgi:hypothetical protein
VVTAVVMQCPVTGRDTEVGMEMDESSLANSTFRNYSFGCQQCGDRHIAHHPPDFRLRGQPPARHVWPFGQH